MMIRTNGVVLDFNDFIEVEKKAKLFEEISDTQGDFSYSSSMPLTSRNVKALGIPYPDVSSKTIYQTNQSEILDDSGNVIYRGSIRVESIEDKNINFSFFSGNTNWLAMLTGNMTELRLSKYDVDLTQLNISASWNNLSGIIFPIIDTGALVTRGYSNLVTEDFVGCFYIHTLLRETFQQSGLKIEGELLDDPFFKSLVICTNTRSLSDVQNNGFNVGTETPQIIPSVTEVDITLPENTSNPFYLGNQITAVSDIDFYVSADMITEIEVSNTWASVGDSPLIPGFKVNGAFAGPNLIRTLASSSPENGFTSRYLIRLSAGDYITMHSFNGQGVSITLESAYMKITPQFIYKTFGGSCVPLWSKQDFVTNVLRMFNTVVAYDEFTKTVTINLFDKIKQKEPIDVSEIFKQDKTDYTEFIQSYGQVNNFVYDDGNDPDLDEYNISSFIKYGSGSIEADNDFIEESQDVVESDFSTPVSYVNSAFNGSLERINFVELEEGDDGEITSVTDSGGVPRFNITDADTIFADGDLVSILTDITDYNGDFVVSAVTSTYIQVRGLDYSSDATGSATLLTHQLTTDENVYIFSITGERTTSDVFSKTSIYVDESATANSNLAFFNLLRIGNAIESDYKQGLSFGSVSNNLFFQRTLIDSYWQQFKRILNDPVKLFGDGYIPAKIYRQIDFLRPVKLSSIQSSNMYYFNRITGYEDQSKPCRIELIKLS